MDKQKRRLVAITDRLFLDVDTFLDRILDLADGREVVKVGGSAEERNVSRWISALSL